MAITLELRCVAHGPFENHEKKCLWGCPDGFVTQEFRTPPRIKHGKTKFVDQQLQGLANDFGLSDIRNGKDGESVMETLKKGKPGTINVQGQEVQVAPYTVPIEHSAPGWSQRGEKASKVSASSLIGTPGENHASSIVKTMKPKAPVFVNPPNPEPGAWS